MSAMGTRKIKLADSLMVMIQRGSGAPECTPPQPARIARVQKANVADERLWRSVLEVLGMT